MRGTFILSEKWIIRRLFDASKLEITVLHPLVTSKRFLFVIVLYIYIYSRGDFTCSLHRVERCYVARCAKNWLPVTGNLDYTADILQIPE